MLFRVFFVGSEKINISRENCIKERRPRQCFRYLINLSAQHLFPVVIIREKELQDIQQAPEGFLLVQEEKGDSGDPVEALTVLDVWVVKAVGQQNSS